MSSWLLLGGSGFWQAEPWGLFGARRVVEYREDLKRGVYMSHLLLLGKFEYSGGPIFKVVLEC